MKRSFVLTLTLLFVLIAAGCKKTDRTDGMGHLVIKITDAPFPMDIVESATVTISKVELRKAGDGISDGPPFIVVSEEPATFNLLELRNGVSEKLIDLEIPGGQYDLVRLYVDSATLKVREGDYYKLKVPSGPQTGIKIFIRPSLNVSGGLTSELLIDFDLSRSFVLLGNPFTPAGIKGFLFKPVIRAVNNSIAGRLEGIVADTANVKLDNASVWLKQDTIISTASTDSLGRYAIIGVPAGTYSLHATREKYDTVSFTDVKVMEGNRTIRNFTLTPQQ
ncbi:MAG: DUF4382 domain-containing protein [Bacteroidales bacterium]|jgi:hypothetical protein|nr:DUF4382 domain-containing protein [Bacteroidales bacterium]